ncbi:MAG: cytochrome c3 family protein [Desulfobacteraceae bacterium]
MRPLPKSLNKPGIRLRRWMIWAILLLICLPGIAAARFKPPSNPKSAKACAICHYRWIDTFFIQGKGSDLVPYQAEKVVATAPMCYSCHDGSVQDSRRKADQNLIHQINNPVPAHMGIPDQFPLGKNNTILCATCHTPHALPGGANTGETIFMRASLKNSAMCLMCHGDKVYIKSSKHNLAYSAPGEKNLEGKTVEDTGPCSACHLQHAMARDLTGKKDFSTQLCFSCHRQGNIAESFQLKGYQHPIQASVTVAGNTLRLPLFNAHDDQQADGLITCATCHDAHRWDPNSEGGEIRAAVKGDRTNSFLRKPAPQLCGACHIKMAYVEGTDHDLSLTAPQSVNIQGQDPDQSGACGVCHLVHNAENEIVLWARGFGPGNNIMERICNSCHSNEGTVKAKIPVVYSHPREKLIQTRDRPDFFPIFHAATGKPVNEGNLSCPSCHNAHQWNAQTPSKGNGQEMEGTLTDSFLRPRASFEYCAECHPKDAAAQFEYFHDATKRRYKSFEQQFFPSEQSGP